MSGYGKLCQLSNLVRPVRGILAIILKVKSNHLSEITQYLSLQRERLAVIQNADLTTFTSQGRESKPEYLVKYLRSTNTILTLSVHFPEHQLTKEIIKEMVKQ